MNETNKPEPIERIETRYPNEWLAIRVTKVDKNRVPVEGIVLVHGCDRKEVRLRARGTKEHIFFTFSGDPVPPGMEVVLSGNIPL